jgi:ATP-binding protein involved in chromosome partitioning
MKERNRCGACAKRASCADQETKKNCLEERMGRIKHKILIASGKGGVGKSTVTVNMAKALRNRGFEVGILDADITGPNIPKLLGIEDQRMSPGPEGLTPGNAQGIKVASMALTLPGKDSAIVWRGPMKMAAIKQFLETVNWGDLDFLLVDLPPGTSDEPISVIQLLLGLDGAIIVTTPQEVSLLDSRKAVNMAKSMKVPVLGIVENMSGLCCPHCGEVINIFSTGGGKRAAEELGVPFLGAVPIDPEVSALGDKGIPFVEMETKASSSFEEIVKKVLDEVVPGK